MKQKKKKKNKKEKNDLEFFPNREIECSEEKFRDLIDNDDGSGGLTIRFDDEEGLEQPNKEKLDLRLG
jgi:hypothetical protein